MNKKNKLTWLDFSVLTILIAIVIFSLVHGFDLTGNIKDKEMITNSFIRLSFSMFFIIILLKSDLKKHLELNLNKKTLMLFIPFLIISINNFPISAYFKGNTTFNGHNYQIILFLIECFTVGLFEELIFRLIIIVLLMEVFKKSKNKELIVLFLSSITFSLIHLVNLFDRASFGDVLLQMGYSFLIGLVFALIFLKTNNILLVVVLHSLYNFFGEVMFYLGEVTKRWDLITIILTILLSFLNFIYYFKVLMNEKKYPTVI